MARLASARHRAVAMSVPDPSVPLAPPPNTHVLAKGTVLHRVWHERFVGNSFNPGRVLTRFAPVADAEGHVVPVLYAGSTCESAFHERIFHDVPVESLFRHIHVHQLEGLTYGTFTIARELTFAQLFRPDLARWELTREQLVHTEADQYLMTARWAEAIYREHPHIEGLVWTSHRCDPDLAYVFFGGRVAPDDLVPNGDAALILEEASLLRSLEASATRAGIRILTS